MCQIYWKGVKKCRKSTENMWETCGKSAKNKLKKFGKVVKKCRKSFWKHVKNFLKKCGKGQKKKCKKSGENVGRGSIEKTLTPWDSQLVVKKCNVHNTIYCVNWTIWARNNSIIKQNYKSHLEPFVIHMKLRMSVSTKINMDILRKKKNWRR